MSSPNISSLYKTIKKLRDPNDGCPWDLKQNHQTLLKFLIEECYEAVNAIESDDPMDIMDELGDVQLQILLHSIIAEENNNFSLQEVFNNLEEKIIRRHPHVFKSNKNISVEEVKKNWQEIKASEDREEHEKQKVLITKKQMSGPSLSVANSIGEFTHKKNFDWNDPEEVFQKVKEELNELEEEINKKDSSSKTQEELGDLLFSMAQLCRHLDFCPEQTLKLANKKFQTRYNKMIYLNNHIDIDQLPREQQESLWLKVKKAETK